MSAGGVCVGGGVKLRKRRARGPGDIHTPTGPPMKIRSQAGFGKNQKNIHKKKIDTFFQQIISQSQY
jgi:hypothetical protein